MTSIRERKQGAAAGRERWLPEPAFYAGLVVLVIVAAIVVAVTRGGEEEPAATEVARSAAVLNSEPWGEPNYRLLDEILNPVTPAPAAAATGAVLIEIGGFAIAEPWGEPDLLSIVDPVGADFRAMEPVAEPDAALLAEILDPVGTGLRAMEPTGTPNYELLHSIVGAADAEPAAGPR